MSMCDLTDFNKLPLGSLVKLRDKGGRFFWVLGVVEELFESEEVYGIYVKGHGSWLCPISVLEVIDTSRAGVRLESLRQHLEAARRFNNALKVVTESLKKSITKSEQGVFDVGSKG